MKKANVVCERSGRTRVISVQKSVRAMKTFSILGLILGSAIWIGNIVGCVGEIGEPGGLLTVASTCSSSGSSSGSSGGSETTSGMTTGCE